MPARSRVSRQKNGSFLSGLATVVLVVGVIYVAKPVLVPLALATLVSFILMPLVAVAQRRGLGRVPATLVVVALTMLISAAVAWGVGFQLVRLAQDLPRHATEISDKIIHLRGSGVGPFSKLIDTVQSAMDTAASGIRKTPVDTVSVSPATQTPITPPPAVIQPTTETSSLERLTSVASTLLEPIADASVVIILAIFVLIRREDLRNRIIGLLGHGRLTGTTRVLVGSAERVSRLLLMQLCVNSCFGCVFAIALLLIGVPYWFLWGFLMVVLRFVPYIGSWMAAALPTILSFAVSPGFAQPLLVLGTFMVLDLVTANAIEPLLFGHSTGVSPVALLVAAVFWTWVWGPVGLVLSTPLTVCLVVLGQHVPRLRVLALVLGDQPALAPSVSFYQRLLASDKDEAADLARSHTLAHGLQNVPDDVLLPALLMARRDREQTGLSATDEQFILDSTQQVLEELQALPVKTSSAVAAAQSQAAASTSALRILGCPAHHKAEETLILMVGSVLRETNLTMELVTTRTLPSEIEQRVADDPPAMVFVAVMPPGGVTQARYLCRRLRKRFKTLPIVVGYFGKVADFDKLLVRLRSAGASYVTTSVAQTRSQLLALAPMIPAEPAAAAATDTAPAAAAMAESRETPLLR